MAARVTAKKTAAKRPSRPRVPAPVAEPEPESSPLDPGAGGEFEVLRLTRRTDRAEEREPLFYIDDVEYTILKRPSPNVGLQCLHLFRTQGDGVATDYVLAKLLGPEGYAALREYDDLTPPQYKQICQIAIKRALGSLEVPKE